MPGRENDANHFKQGWKVLSNVRCVVSEIKQNNETKVIFHFHAMCMVPTSERAIYCEWIDC